MGREFEIILFFAVISAAALAVLIPVTLKSSTGINRIIVRVFYISAVSLGSVIFALHCLYDGIMHTGAEKEGLRVMMSFDYEGTADGYHILTSRGFQSGATYFPDIHYAVPEEGRTAIPLAGEVTVWYDETEKMPSQDAPTVRVGQFDCCLWDGAKRIFPAPTSYTFIYIFVVIPIAVIVFGIAEAVYITVKKRSGNHNSSISSIKHL